MAAPTFEPTRCIWVCIHNSDYSDRRKIPGNEGFEDIEECDKDAVNFRKGVKQLGARQLHIKDIPDAGYDDFKELFRDLQRELLQGEANGDKTLVFIYYAGHGIQRNLTYAVANEEKVYPLEKMLRVLATTPKSYVLAVLDCCRAEFKASHRGFQAADNSNPDADQRTNLVLTYGCPPSDTTPAKSTISVAYFDKLRAKAEDATGIVTLPHALVGWRGTDGKSETLTLTDMELKLKFDNWTPRNPQPTAAPARGAPGHVPAADYAGAHAAQDAEIEALRAQLAKQQQIAKLQAQLASTNLTMAQAAAAGQVYQPASQVKAQAEAICGMGVRGQRIHYFHQPGKVLMFFDPSDGTVRKKMVGVNKELPKFSRTFWTDPGRLFLFGGRIGDVVVNNTLEYNGKTKEFEERGDMCEPRSDSTVVYVPHLDRIYVLGGNDRKRFYSECEYYEPAKD